MNSQEENFLDIQLSFPRVAEAHTRKLQIVKEMFEKKGISFPSSQIFWRAFKWNKQLELWAFHSDSAKYILVQTFSICAVIGDPGPKRQEGDFQIPEGFYYFSSFNPVSKYHLSMKISYPNESDAILGNKSALGGEIYLHGGCETIGCIPMTDDLIEEIYIINMYAKANGLMDIPIHIFPTRMTIKNMNKLKMEYFKDDTVMINFFYNLKEGYDYFELNHLLPFIAVDLLTGKYIIQKP